MHLLMQFLVLALFVCFANADGGSNTNNNNNNGNNDYLSKTEIAAWHDKLYETLNFLGAPGGGSSGLRAWAIMVLAMFETSNTVDQKYSPYLVRPSDVPSTINYGSANKRAAVAKAAQTVLDGVFNLSVACNTPGANSVQTLLYAHAQLVSIQCGALNPNAASTIHGFALGVFIAQRILANRTGDGHPPPNVVPPSGTEWYQYQYGLPYFPGTAQSKGYVSVRPFALGGFGYGPAGPDNGAVTNVVPIPANNTQAWKDKWVELYRYGTSSAAQSTRTPATDATARFHDGNFGSQIGNMADVLSSASISKESTDLLRIVALTAMSSHDAHANHWYWKYFYLIGRPISQYRQVPVGEVSHLDDQKDVNWTPVLTTSQNPEYPSGHACRTGGFTASLRRGLGDDVKFRIISFSQPAAPARTFNSFTQLQDEVMVSRTYGGVHWRFSGYAGRDSAERVTNYVWSNYLLRSRNIDDDDDD